MKRALPCLLLVLTACGGRGGSVSYKDASQPVEARVADLLGRMTLEEKVAQTLGAWKGKDKITDDEGRFVPAKARDLMANGIGVIARPSELRDAPKKINLGPRENALFLNDVQKWLVENTRLGIPALTHEEALHGLTAPKGTNFPVPIALASAWDPDLVEKVMTVAALEARARGTHHVLSPVLDLARDPRWGRTEETYGEDPYLVTRLGVAAIHGYQGREPKLGPDRVFATAKHYAVHGPHEGGINTAPGNFSERLMRDQYLVSFEAAVREANVATVMPSYNEIDGIPAHKNRFLLEKVLRGEWGFAGLVVSDYYAIEQMKTRHGVAFDSDDAARQAIEAGVDVELPDVQAFGRLGELVKSGRVSQKALDRAVSRVLRAKFLAGLFENAAVDPERAVAVSNTPEHQALALTAARRSLVLLKNDGTLPLDRARLRTIAVIGPNAAGVHLGGYSSVPGRGVSILQGVQDKAGTGIRVLHSEGVRITEHEANWTQDKVEFGDPVKNRQRMAEAVGIARLADVVIAVVGTNESTSREAWEDNHLGDVAELALSSQQDELVEALQATGKPVVIVLMNGRPLAIPRIAETAPAILEAFYVGQEGGTAVAEALFGDVNPGGKLPITFPRSSGQLPVYYGRKPTSFRAHLDLTRDPLFAFGHGLSYTTFKLENLKLAPATIAVTGETTVSVDVVNTGARKGDEVVQVYIRDRVSSVTRPVKELCGFQRVTLDPGARATLQFKIGPPALRLTDENMSRVVEPGAFDVMVGTGVGEPLKASLEVTGS
jgi:beta-glucosidase